MKIQWWEGEALSCAEAVLQSATGDCMRPEAGRMRKRIVSSVVEELEKGRPFRGKAQRYGASGKTLSNWRESLQAAAVTNGGERSWISEAVSLSMTIIGPPHLGQDQRSLGSAGEGSCSGFGAPPITWTERGT